MALITANALSPACKQYKYFYPSVALVGPTASGLPPIKEELPFDSSWIPPDHGVVIAYNNRVRKADRPIFTLHADELNKEVDLLNSTQESGLSNLKEDLSWSWYLPHGLSQECLFCSPFDCDFSNSLGVPVFSPGTYYIVVFNTMELAGDYNLSIGTGEQLDTCEGFQNTIDILEEILSGEIYHIKKCISDEESDFIGCEK